MTAEDFRRITLALDGAVEKSHMGHPDFRVNGRIFATLDAQEEWGVVMLTPEEQREFIRDATKVFVPAAGAFTATSPVEEPLMRRFVAGVAMSCKFSPVP